MQTDQKVPLALHTISQACIEAKIDFHTAATAGLALAIAYARGRKVSLEDFLTEAGMAFDQMDLSIVRGDGSSGIKETDPVPLILVEDKIEKELGTPDMGERVTRSFDRLATTLRALDMLDAPGAHACLLLAAALAYSLGADTQDFKESARIAFEIALSGANGKPVEVV